MAKRKSVYQMTVNEYIAHKVEWNKRHKITEPPLSIQEAKKVLDVRKKLNLYTKVYFQRNKDSMSESHKKYLKRIREEKIARGEIVVLTPEEKAQRSNEKRLASIEKAKEKYNKNIDGFRDNAIKHQKERYYSDEEFREEKKRYHRQWRSNKRAEALKYKDSEPEKYNEILFQINKGGKQKFLETLKNK